MVNDLSKAGPRPPAAGFDAARLGAIAMRGWDALHPVAGDDVDAARLGAIEMRGGPVARSRFPAAVASGVRRGQPAAFGQRDEIPQLVRNRVDSTRVA